jgi:hypothetical protein
MICKSCGGIGFHDVNCHATHAADPIYCTAQTYASTRLEQAEYCENEVTEEGDLCSAHDADARMDDDYDRYLQSRDDS